MSTIISFFSALQMRNKDIQQMVFFFFICVLECFPYSNRFMFIDLSEFFFNSQPQWCSLFLFYSNFNFEKSVKRVVGYSAVIFCASMKSIMNHTVSPLRKGK